MHNLGRWQDTKLLGELKTQYANTVYSRLNIHIRIHKIYTRKNKNNYPTATATQIKANKGLACKMCHRPKATRLKTSKAVHYKCEYIPK